MNAYHTDPRVAEYMKSLPIWQQDICRQVRDLVHAADTQVTETSKRTRQPYFTLNGNICALLVAKDHVTIFIYDPIAPDPEGIINQGHDNLTARSIQVHQGESMNQQALLHLFIECLPLVVCLGYTLWDVLFEPGGSPAMVARYVQHYQEVRQLSQREKEVLRDIILFRHYVITTVQLHFGDVNQHDLDQALQREQDLRNFVLRF